MLNLLDRQIIEGLTVYRDDQDVRKFYVLPDTPIISEDPQGNPRFLFIKYVDDREGVAEENEKNGAYTQFHATLGITDERRERLMTGLRERLTEEKRKGIKPFGKTIASTEPLLARPDWTEGNVSLATFSVGEEGMVRSVAGSKKPDLAGDLDAAFALELDDAGSSIFWDAFESGDVPIVLAYELTYKARVPAAKMVIHAEREKVKNTVWSVARPFIFKPAIKKFSPLPFAQAFNRTALLSLRRVHGPMVRAMVPKKTVTTSITNVIEVDITGGEGGDGSVSQRLMEIASEILTNNIIPAFFAGNAILSELTDVEEGDDLLELKDDIEDSLEPFHIELTEEVAVDRYANPSGFLRMLLTEEQRTKAFREVPLSDPFFQQLNVTVRTAGVELERDGIDSIHVFLEYDHRDSKTGERIYKTDDKVITSDDEELLFEIERLARDRDGLAITRYRIRTEVNYLIDLPRSVGQWTEQEHRQVLIAPRALGAIRVELVLTARPESIESAEVRLSYRNADGQRLEQTLTLTEKEPRKSWFQFTGEFGPDGVEDPSYQYQVTWKLPGGAEIEGKRKTSTVDVLEIGTPFSTPLEFTIRTGMPMDGVTEIAGELRYEDEARNYRVIREITLKSDGDKEVFTIPTLDGGPQTAKITGRIRYEDGTDKELPEVEAEAGTTWLGEAVDKWLTVFVQPFDVDFEGDVKVATVMITYTHADGKEEPRRPLNFIKGGPLPIDNTTEWKVALVEGDPETFDYEVRYIGYDGRSDHVTFEKVSDTMIWLKRPPAPE